MKKALIILMLLIAVVTVSCVFDSVTYCPYCKSRDISEVEEGSGVYKCGKCTKTFGAMKL